VIGMSGYRYGAGEGETYDWRGARVTLKTTGEETRRDPANGHRVSPT
jgi:hypothetical protein